MNAEDIGKIVSPKFPDVYAVTYAPTTLFFKDGSIKVGYFQQTDEAEGLKKQNIFTFVEFGVNAQGYKATADKKYITKVKGDDLIRVEYPPLILVQYRQIFNVYPNGMITPRIPVRIGGVTMGPGVRFGGGVLVGGVNLHAYSNRNIEGYIDKGVFVITAFK